MIKNSSVVISTLVALGALLQSGGVMANGSVVAKVGTLGAGLEYVHPINSTLAIGFGVNGLSYDDSIEESDINYDADLQMQSFALSADYHPWENGFRITASVLHNGNEFSLEGTPTGEESVEINGNSYSAADVGSLTGTIDFESMAPYLGIGWGHAPKAGKGWAFDADVGVLFQGEPNTTLSATCGAALSDSDCAALQADVADEAVSFKTDSEDFDVYPVVSVGVSYRF